ncbi:NAD-dependent epimerase/dehydratase family protein [Palleronia pelagia]|uniref:NAD dependent epimerase/dehydratase family protein n=1 Tax=Palleronia pelagia TaxID=387096 RepID=A0A1H8GVL6_9RHOB|nr:NAD-dependent epimerase/dehydratase family protein [Palleronia pelagia]SEN47318.1 NAD dependent epimerase/dehydratase family protein [Palleronia pelagia]
MKPLILIGATGLVGARLVRAFPLIGREVVRIGREAGSGIDLRWDMDSPPPPCPSARGAAVVVLAGVTPVSGDAFDRNAILARAGVAAARHWGAAHVFVMSTSAVYGDTGDRPASEDAAQAGTSPYARAKLEMEHAVRGPDVTALRLANVAGASEPFLSIRRGTARLDQFTDAPDAPSRSFIGPVTMARALAALADRAEAGEPLPSVLNLAGRTPLPMADIFTSANVSPDRVAAPPGAVARVHLDVGALDRLWPVPSADAAALWDEVRATDPVSVDA